MATAIPSGFYILQTEDGRDVLLPNGVNTSVINGTTVQFASTKDSFGYKGYRSRVTTSGTADRFDRTSDNLTKLRTIVGMIEATMSIQIRLLSVDYIFEANEI